MTIQQYEQRAEVALSQEVAIQRLGEWAHSAEAAHGIATTLVQTSFCPEQFRNKAGEATAAILAGIEVGLQPMAALRSFDIIQGQAAPRAITLRAVVQSHGHEMVLVESTATRCKMRGRRRGSDQWQEVVWTLDRARDLGVTNKSNWKQQPQAMLVARCTSELARLIASDAILGIGYSAEEVADGGTYDEQVAVDTTTPAAQPGTRRMSRPRPQNSEVGDEVQGANPGSADVVSASVEPPASESPDPITSAQLTKIGILCGELGLTDPAEARREVGAVIGREIKSRKDLSKDEAHRVIDRFTTMVEQPFPPEPVEGTIEDPS